MGIGDPSYDGAWLPPGQSSVLIENTRGALTLALASGSGACGENSLEFNGTTASGSGTWSAKDGAGSYRQATGSGNFSVTATVAPGADNPFQITLSGSISVLDPSVGVELVGASWDRGSESGPHDATVTYRLTNTGPGDSFGVRVVDSTTEGCVFDTTLYVEMPDALDHPATFSALVHVVVPTPPHSKSS